MVFPSERNVNCTSDTPKDMAAIVVRIPAEVKELARFQTGTVL